MKERIPTAPAMALTPQAMDHLVEALRAYHAIYRPVLQRREQREGAATYLHGLLLAIPRTSIEPMVLALDGAPPKTVRTRPLFSSEGAWDDEALLHRHGHEVEQGLGEADGVLTLDGSDCLQQGRESVGVKRQDGGAVGKRAHGQAGVSVGDASRPGSTLLDRRRSWPQAWVADDASAERRRRGGVPADLPCKPKPAWGWERIQARHRAQPLRARGVTCDAALGRDTSVLDPIDGLGLWYWAEVSHDTQGWPHRPATAVPPWTGQGRNPTRTRGLAGATQRAEVAQLAAALPADRWTPHTLKEGSTGPLVARFAAVRVSTVRDGLPGPEVWLVLRRHLVTGEPQTSLSHAPADTALSTLGRLRGMRWPIETCCEDGKQSLGMGDDAVRGWRGGHHPMTLCIVAHLFLVRACLR